MHMTQQQNTQHAEAYRGVSNRAAELLSSCYRCLNKRNYIELQPRGIKTFRSHINATSVEIRVKVRPECVVPDGCRSRRWKSEVWSAEELIGVYATNWPHAAKLEQRCLAASPRRPEWMVTQMAKLYEESRVYRILRKRNHLQEQQQRKNFTLFTIKYHTLKILCPKHMLLEIIRDNMYY